MTASKKTALIGITSDTHGRFDPALKSIFKDADLLLHAGDVCGMHVITELNQIAPVRAIQGNCDLGYDSASLPEYLIEEVFGQRVLIVHDLGKPSRPHPAIKSLILEIQPRIVLSGHSHKGHLEIFENRLYINPGSSGKKRFNLARSVVLLHIASNQLCAELIELEPSPRTVEKLELNI